MERAMSRGGKPTKPKVEAEPPTVRKSVKDEGSSRVRDLERRLAEALQREAGAVKREAEALEQQTATSEILRVIARSPTDLQPVMETIAENAARVCGATDSSIYRLEGEYLRLVARQGSMRRPRTIGEAVPISRGIVSGRVVLDGRTIHVEDVMAAETEFLNRRPVPFWQRR
jgi:two-component system NtrC family sensor kinase